MILTNKSYSLYNFLPSLDPTVAGEDYVAIVNEQQVYTIRQSRACYRVIIPQDNICEIDRIEDFFANLTYFLGIQPIIIDIPRTRVIIDDTNEPECGK